MNTTTKHKAKKSPRPWDLRDPRELVRLLEGPADRAAAAFLIDGAGLLVNDREGGHDMAIENFEAPDASFNDVNPNYALSKFSELQDTLKVTDEQFQQIQTVVYDAVHHRTTTAYLFGLAVGRRLTSAPLRAR
jgi:hypothetical protein